VPRQDSIDKARACQISDSRTTPFDMVFRGDSDQITLCNRMIKAGLTRQNCPDRKTALSQARPFSYEKGYVHTLAHGHHASIHGAGPASRFGLRATFGKLTGVVLLGVGSDQSEKNRLRQLCR
jgi:hypothetical protein